jgi:hypothetical protein
MYERQDAAKDLTPEKMCQDLETEAFVNNNQPEILASRYLTHFLCQTQVRVLEKLPRFGIDRSLFAAMTSFQSEFHSHFLVPEKQFIC